MRHENRSNIVPLDELDDFEVADHDPDVRGWHVVSGDGRRIGEVEELLVDSTALKVRYLDVELDDEWSASDRDRHILIPIGHARLDEDGDRVVLNSLRAEQVRSIPPYSGGPVERQYEDSLRSHFYSGSSTVESRDYYVGDDFDDTRFYGTRRRGSSGDPTR
jgi:photosynthetic reaction center H subunit